MTKNQVRLHKVLTRMIELNKEDESFSECINDGLDGVLEDFAMDDGFGTERQLDPRGDGRDGEWSMDRVQGVDD